MKLLRELIEFIMREHKKLQRLYKAATVLACIVVFVTTYALMLPAISLDKKAASKQTGLRLDPANSPVVEMSADSGQEDAGSELGAAVPGIDDETGGGGSSGASDESVAAGADTADDGTGDNDVVSASDDGSGDEADGTSGGESDTGVEDTGSDLDDGDDPGTYDSDASADSEGADRESADSEAADYEAADAGDDAEDSTYDEAGSTSDPADTTITEDSTEDAAAAIAATALLALQEDEFITEETELTAEGDGYKVYVTVDAKAMLPKAATVSVREINKDKDENEFALYFDKAQKELRDKYDDSTSLAFARFYDISFLYEGVKIEPASPVKVRFEFDRDKEPEVARKARIDMIHFDEFEFEEKMLTETERSKFIESDRSEFIESEMKTGDKAKILTGAGIELGSQEPFNDDDVYVVNGGVSKGGTFSGSSNDAGTYTKNRRYSKSARKSSIEEISDLQKLSEFEFSSDQFSVYGVLGTVIEKIVIGSDGNSYKINVTYGAEAEVPEGAGLETMEIIAPEGEDEDSISSEGNDEVEELADTSLYDTYVSKIEETLGLETGSASNVRLFDIRIEDQDGEKVDIQAPVKVEIELADADDILGEETRIIHFAADSGNGEVIDDFDVDGDTISFEADGFSAYAIVEGPPPVDVPDQDVMTVDELAQNYNYENGFYLSYGTSTINYFTNQVKSNTVYVETQELGDASVWYFESAGENKYYVYTYTASDKQYMYNTSGNNMNLSATNKTAFVVSRAKADGKFYFKADGQDKWLQHSKGGGGIRLYTDNNNDTNSRIIITYVPEELEDDPYKLDGLTYGLMNWNGGAAGKALMASSSAANTLDAKALTCMTNEDDDEDKLFVPSNSDISMWTFESAGADTYYLKTVVDSSTMYLKISSSGLALTANKEEAGAIQVVPGTGIHAGEISLKANGKTLTYSGDVNQGFGVGGSAGSEWLHLTEESTLTEDYFRTYSASKVSVSDPSVTNGSKIVVYTRSWNEQKKRYELYAVKGDGTLVPCYESGDSIEWVGGQFNELLWDFVEYYEEGTSTPTYFYELYNQYSEKFIAPQVTDGQITSDDPIGINLNGRRDGKYYSTVLAWDDTHYAYAGLKVENGKIVSCPKSESMDFYFATMEDLPVDDKLHTVSTVDNYQHGITMKMVDLENIQGTLAGQMNGFLGSYAGGATYSLQQGLLADHLDQNGYPMTTKTSQSLADLYSGEKTVNHLFIESTYNATGYFEFDSSQNFAHLNGSDFEVYKELGSYDQSSKPSLKHGQFFPYNNIEPGVYAVLNGKNLYDAVGHPLSDDDPRRNEQLYLIKNTDPYFAMELEAGFIQTPNGHDDWGHDIIYEFTGDDDFWLYVDGELVIDLGGIHSAVPGSVNFSTGEVSVNGRRTTLYDIFREHYSNRPGVDVEAELAKKFQEKEVGGETRYVFKDNSSHRMKIFYMERGAGASNLHMRFNLASIKPGTFLLGKELSGVNAEETVLAEFPFQIRYKIRNTRTEEEREEFLTNTASKDYVIYKGTTHGVTSKETFTIHDGEAGDITYRNVFILRPGELAEVSFPPLEDDDEEIVGYYVTECGVNTVVYDDVSVNSESLEGSAIEGHPDRKDYAIEYDTTDNRAKVAYENQVDPDALRTVTINKRLFHEDGETQIHYAEDQTAFNFRLYLGTESDDELSLANMHTYHVKDPNGYYCIWNAATQKFEPTSYTNYSDVPDSMKTAVSFNTSMNGSISKIPVDHTVELRELLVGTQYRVEERSNEIPDGYSFQNYKWRNTQNASVVGRILDEETGKSVPGVNDTVEVGEDPDVDVCNLKGWGLRLNKVWSDADYMSDRDPTYYAVFTEDAATGALTLSPGTERELPYGAKPQTLYWYFQKLPNREVDFDHYVMREVKLGGSFTVDDEGVVTGYTSMDIIDEGGEVDLNGKQKGEASEAQFTYTVTYQKGIPDLMANLRVDTVTNNRPGIVLRKEDWDGAPLAGCRFTLTDDAGVEIGTFTSDDTGLISVAFLRDNVPYSLEEVLTPKGYRGLDAPMTVLLDNGNVSVSGVDAEYYDLQQGGGTTPTLTVKNRPYAFRAVKVSGSDGDEAPLPGIHFSLHRQITVDGQTSYDINPMAGFEDIISDVNGYLPGLDIDLREGTFELREKDDDFPAGYEKLPSHVHFRKTLTGVISLVDTNPDEVSLSEDALEDGTIEYVLKIRNDKSKIVSFCKVDISDPQHVVLPDAFFDLYRVEEGEEVKPALYVGLKSGADGLLVDSSGSAELVLDSGVYHLVETKAPPGYNTREDPIEIQVGTGPKGVIYDDGTSFPNENYAITVDSDGVITILITNTSGVELPASGGSGTKVFVLFGFILAVIAGAGLILNRRWV